MSVDLYGLYTCSSCRAILLTAEAIGIEVNFITVDLENGEHQTPEYEEMNPQKLIPTLVDGDYKLGESRAILAYLADQYDQNERLYPKNPGSRALVDHRLYFDIGTLYKAIAAYYYPVAFYGRKEFDSTKYPRVEEVYEMLDKYLEGQDYVAGKNLTIADLSITATVTTSEVFGFDVSKYENVSRWLEKMKTSAPGYRKANGEGLEMLGKQFQEKLEAIENELVENEPENENENQDENDADNEAENETENEAEIEDENEEANEEENEVDNEDENENEDESEPPAE
ncbi:glutathione S-transferase 1-1-like [Leptopilina heterotoma]|uniref:glutathione S-transferase 1-1-like n=1 Tax=Leptopilina heterotoma TaxID=63436 RepID=UPI001CA960F2|nr:glutathione S-transferase 1-1-like [Leptopilina heterotoma]XP_043463060.1 glutathione S-transferase 1-1-like [Leptopilina heterotoma]XP_043463061.1 glutathione S-transferase 1-1-like [Leptopilina heterotoma]